MKEPAGPQSETWNAIPAVAYTLSEDELQVASQFIIAPATRPRICFAVASILAFANAGLQLFFVHSTFARPITFSWLAVGLLYTFAATRPPINPWWRQRLQPD